MCGVRDNEAGRASGVCNERVEGEQGVGKQLQNANHTVIGQRAHDGGERLLRGLEEGDDKNRGGA